MEKYSFRKSPRIPDFNYNESYYYFITICTHEKKCIFGMDKELTALGNIAYNDMVKLPEHYQGVTIDHFVIMPNHIHAIIILTQCKERKSDLNNIIGAYKAGVSRKIRQIYPDINVWQRSFHDHVIRNKLDYENIWEYIENNPSNWNRDKFWEG